MTGYEVFVKGIEDKPTELLGVTDWRGSIEVPRGDVPVRTLYVKNGNQLLARLPLVFMLRWRSIADVMGVVCTGGV